MLKWLKNGKEFYRSVPKALLRPNRRRMFHVEGVKVDIENSKVRIMKNVYFSLIRFEKRFIWNKSKKY